MTTISSETSSEIDAQSTISMMQIDTSPNSHRTACKHLDGKLWKAVKLNQLERQSISIQASVFNGVGDRQR